MTYDYLHLTKKQIVLVAPLVGSLELPLSFWERRTEYTSDPNVFETYTGLPFEAIKIKNTLAFDLGLKWYEQRVRGTKYPTWYGRYKTQQHERDHPMSRDPIVSALIVSQTRECLWNGIILNTILFTIFSIIIVKLSTRIHDRIEYRRYYKP